MVSMYWSYRSFGRFIKVNKNVTSRAAAGPGGASRNHTKVETLGCVMRVHVDARCAHDVFRGPTFRKPDHPQKKVMAGTSPAITPTNDQADLGVPLPRLLDRRQHPRTSMGAPEGP